MKKYIVAVSGGLDSVTLLNLLTSPSTHLQLKGEVTLASLEALRLNSELIVAHINHGIRSDSDKTEQFVRNLASGYNLKFVSTKLKLKGTGEDEARRARYQALFKLKDELGAEGIITAHNLNDTLETAIINLTRGTGWRGLCSLGSNNQIIRPLLNLSRAEISKITAEANLSWHEDSTNSDEKYLRNHIRKNVIPALSSSQLKHLSLIILNLKNIKSELDDILNQLIECGDDGSLSLNRSWLIKLDDKTISEVLVHILPKFGATYDKKVVSSLLRFCLDAVNGKKFLQAGKNLEVESAKMGRDYQIKFSRLN